MFRNLFRLLTFNVIGSSRIRKHFCNSVVVREDPSLHAAMNIFSSIEKKLAVSAEIRAIPPQLLLQ
jgi:hypothetical protein